MKKIEKLPKDESNLPEVYRWIRQNGDKTLGLTYDLNEDSIVMDLGGYTGVWLNQIVEKYNPNIYAIEPIKLFYDEMVETLEHNKKSNFLNVGVSNVNDKNGVIYINGDETSDRDLGGDKVTVEFQTMDVILKNWGLDEVDVLQINIEGAEYPLLNHMIENDLLKHFKNIKIQFHLNCGGNEIFDRNRIHNSFIAEGFTKTYDYTFVWENWERK